MRLLCRVCTAPSSTAGSWPSASILRIEMLFRLCLSIYSSIVVIGTLTFSTWSWMEHLQDCRSWTTHGKHAVYHHQFRLSFWVCLVKACSEAQVCKHAQRCIDSPCCFTALWKHRKSTFCANQRVLYYPFMCFWCTICI
jgi:hypothetical protein